MRRSGFCLSVLPMLVFIAVSSGFVSSASVKGQNEEFLTFLKDALVMNAPPESPAPEIFHDMSNSFVLSDPTAVCTLRPLDNSADTADDKSKENSNSADHTEDSDFLSSKKRNRLPEDLLESPDNSADSNSAERTYTDMYDDMATVKQPSKTQEHRSSQEKDEPHEFKNYQEWKKMNTAKGGEEPTGRYSPDQSQNKEKIRKNKRTSKDSAKAAVTQARDSTPLNDSQSSIDQDLDCIKLSNKKAAVIDLQSKGGISNHKIQLRRMCPGRSRAPSISRDHMDRDSVEKMNSELLDRDNSNERTDAGMPTLTF